MRRLAVFPFLPFPVVDSDLCFGLASQGTPSILSGRRSSRAHQDVQKHSINHHEGRDVSVEVFSTSGTGTRLIFSFLFCCSIQELFRSFPSDDPIVRESESHRSRDVVGESLRSSSSLFSLSPKSSSLPSSSRTNKSRNHPSQPRSTRASSSH